MNMKKKEVTLKRMKNFFDKQILKFLFLFFLFSALYLIFILYNLQVIRGGKYNDQVISQSSKQVSHKIVRRGNIFFRNSENEKVAVALQDYNYTIAFNPSKEKNPEKIFKTINQHLKLDKKSFFQKASKKDDPYEEIVRGVGSDVVSKLKKEKLNLSFIKKSYRRYPFSDISSKVIGFVNFDMRGVYGLEKYYDDILSRSEEVGRESIFRLFFNNNKDKNLFSKKLISKEGDLITSLDIGLSKFLEEVLREIDKKYKSKYSAAIIIKPSSGEILAMTDSKTFDLNKKKRDYRNEFVEYRFEVGSTFKPLVAAIGLESGKIDKNFNYNDLGCIKFPQKTICNFDKKGRGPKTDLQTIISQSLNTGMIEIEKKIGHKTFLNFLLKLGLSEETGIDLPGEISSSISNLNQVNDINYAAASFGQGVAFTPVAITRALSSIASDGYVTTPHLVKRIEYGGLIPDRDFETEKLKVFSPYTINVIKKIMVKRADDYAKNKEYFNPNYAIASKTGTAQIASPKGGYYPDRNIHTYFGFFPAHAKPEDRYAIFIYTMEPRGVKYSSQTLTEPFYKIVNFMIPYFDIKPDRVKIKI
jgi:cell division protein FtsI/penicillin-binding protein 2